MTVDARPGFDLRVALYLCLVMTPKKALLCLGLHPLLIYFTCLKSSRLLLAQLQRQ